MARLQTVQVQGQGGGVNDFARPDMIAPDEIRSSSRNVRGEADFSYNRKGYVSFGDLLDPDIKVSSLGVYRRNNSADDRLIAGADTTLYTNDPRVNSVWTALTTPAISNTDFNIVSYRDWCFLFNGVDKPLRLNGSTLTQDFTPPSTLTVDTFLPSFGEVFNEALFVSGVPSTPNVVYTSKFASAATPANIYSFASSGSTYGDGNAILFPSRVTGMRKIDGALIVFTIDGAFYVSEVVVEQTASSTFIARFPVRPIAGSGGCISHKASCVVETDVFYMTPNKEIKSIKRALVSDTSMNTVPTSIKLQNFLDTQVDNDLSDTFMVYHQTNKELHVLCKPKDGVYNGYRIVGDFKQVDQTGRPSWFIDSFLPFYCGVYYDNFIYYGNTVVGSVHQDNVGYVDDDSTPIVSNRDSKEFTGNNPTTYKKLHEFVWFGEMTQTTTGYIDVYADGQLIKTRQFDASNLASGTSNIEGGIATETVSTFTIATDDDETQSVEELFEIVVRVPLRIRAKKISYTIRTDGVNNYYRGRYIQYSVVPTSDLVNPLIEK